LAAQDGGQAFAVTNIDTMDEQRVVMILLWQNKMQTSKRENGEDGAVRAAVGAQRSTKGGDGTLHWQNKMAGFCSDQCATMDEQRVVTILYNAAHDGGQAFVGTSVAIVN
jgi:hypothetical protein